MQRTAEDARTILTSRIQNHLQRVEVRAERLRRVNFQVTGLNLLFSGAATLLAGVTAAGGPLIGEGPPAWRWTCGIIAVVTAGAALTTGIQQRFKVPEAMARALACAARLRSLDLSLQLSRRGPEEIGEEYEQLLASYPEELT